MNQTKKTIDLNLKLYKSLDFGRVWAGLSYKKRSLMVTRVLMEQVLVNRCNTHNANFGFKLQRNLCFAFHLFAFNR
jgi:hypothetical protein